MQLAFQDSIRNESAIFLFEEKMSREKKKRLANSGTEAYPIEIRTWK